MTAPSEVTRVEPLGIYLEDGHRTTIGCALNPDIAFWEISVKPPGLDNRDPIDTTTMWNDTWITKAPRQLSETTDVTGSAAYDPAVWSMIRNILGVETTWTIKYPNGDKLTFYGYLRSFEKSDHVEGTMPTADYVIVVTNQDPSTSDEEDPVLSATSGTA